MGSKNDDKLGFYLVWLPRRSPLNAICSILRQQGQCQGRGRPPPLYAATRKPQGATSPPWVTWPLSHGRRGRFMATPMALSLTGFNCWGTLGNWPLSNCVATVKCYKLPCVFCGKLQAVKMQWFKMQVVKMLEMVPATIGPVRPARPPPTTTSRFPLCGWWFTRGFASGADPNLQGCRCGGQEGKEMETRRTRRKRHEDESAREAQARLGLWLQATKPQNCHLWSPWTDGDAPRSREQGGRADGQDPKAMLEEAALALIEPAGRELAKEGECSQVQRRPASLFWKFW